MNPSSNDADLSAIDGSSTFLLVAIEMMMMMMMMLVMMLVMTGCVCDIRHGDDKHVLV